MPTARCRIAGGILRPLRPHRARNNWCKLANARERAQKDGSKKSGKIPESPGHEKTQPEKNVIHYPHAYTSKPQFMTPNTEPRRRAGRRAQDSRKQGHPKLMFPESGTPEGLESGSVAQFGGNYADSAVREFLQNSLDAAVEIGVKAKIHVSVEKIAKTDVPGITEYEKAFNSAIKEIEKGGGYNQNAQQIADHIKKGLQQEEISVLFVMDNGAGFSNKGFSAVLGDGISIKKHDRGSGGSYGNGHLTAFPASDLRYVFYASSHRPERRGGGGICECACVGHAIVATHLNEKKHSTGKDGFWVQGIDCSVTYGEKFVPAKGNQIPTFIRPKLRHIQSNSERGTGSVVAVMAFNDFRKEGKLDLVKEVKGIAAMHFFAAIHDDKMEVSVSANGNSGKVDKKNLSKIIEEYRDHKQAPVSGFPAGAVAWRAYNALKHGTKEVCTTDGTNNVDIYLHLHDQGDNAVALCRDGMYITKDIRNISRDEFRLKEPFNAVICLDSESDKDAYKAIKAAESNLHNKLEIAKLSKENAAIFRKITKQIAATIKAKVKDQDVEAWFLPDFVEIVEGENARELRGTNIMDSSGGMRPRGPEPGPKPGKHKGPGPGRKPGPNSIREVQISSRRISPEKMRVAVLPKKDCDRMQLSMSVDMGQSVLDVGHLDSGGWEEIKIRHVSVSAVRNGKREIPATGKRQYVNIGTMKAGERTILDIEHDPPKINGEYTVNLDFRLSTDDKPQKGTEK